MVVFLERPLSLNNSFFVNNCFIVYVIFYVIYVVFFSMLLVCAADILARSLM